MTYLDTPCNIFKTYSTACFSKNDIISKTMACINVSNWVIATINY